MDRRLRVDFQRIRAGARVAICQHTVHMDAALVGVRPHAGLQLAGRGGGDVRGGYRHLSLRSPLFAHFFIDRLQGKEDERSPMSTRGWGARCPVRMRRNFSKFQFPSKFDFNKKFEK